MNKLSVAIKLAIPLAILSLQTQVLHAADGVELTDNGLELTVTANRRPEAKTLTPITVFTRKDIERFQATTLAEVLGRAAGLSVGNSGGLGKVTDVYIRGANAKQMLVLVDGIPFGSETLGETAFQFLPLEQIERIEIIRGPRSSLYGSGAVGGVIQLFTRKGTEGFQPSVKLAIGSNKARVGSINLSGGNSVTSYNLNAQKESFGGIDSCANSGFPTGCGLEPDDDGYKSNSVALKIDHKFKPNIKAQIAFLNKDSDSDYDSSFVNETSNLLQSITGKIDVDASEKLNLQFNVGQSLDESDNFLNGVFKSKYNTKRESYSITSNYKVNNENTLTFGIDSVDASVASSVDYSVNSRENLATFAGYSLELRELQVDASVRYEDNEQFGSKTTGNLSIGRQINEAFRVKASYGTAFNAPSFNDLYYPFESSPFGDYQGNPDLVPEESKNFELGFDGNINNKKWEVNIFQNEIKNNIVYQYDPVLSTMMNLDEVLIRGVEASLASKSGPLAWSINTTVQEPKISNGTDSGNILAKRPRMIANFNLDRDFGRLNLGTTIHAESERFTSNGNTESLGGYARLDLRANYNLTKELNIGLKVENVLDKNYSLNKNYNQDGANGMLTLSYSPK